MDSNAGSREHGVIDGHSTRIVGMDAAMARQVIREEEDLRYPLLASSLEPPVVRIAVGEPVGTLHHGLGANWPPAYQGEEAFPEEDDEAGWARVFGAMSEAGIAWVRYWLELDDLVVDGRVVAEHRFLRRLDRLQAWAAASGATIMLEFCQVPPAWRFDGVHDAPADIDRYVAELLIPVLRHVVHERRIDRIRQLCLYNEPFNADVTPFLFFPAGGVDALEYYVRLHERLRAAMDAAGLTGIGLIGPNSANLFQRHLELFEDRGLGDRVKAAFAELDVHMWRCRFDYYPPSKRWPGYPMSEGIDRYLRPTLAAARRLGKRLSLTEAGSMYFNDHPSSGRLTRHDAVLTMIEQLVRAVNEGISGAMIWSFLNAGKTDGQWGWLSPRQGGFAPVPHLYHGFATLMRHQRPGAVIRHCAVARSDFSSFVAAAAIDLPAGKRTVWLVNDHPVERIRVQLKLQPGGSPGTWKLIRKDFAPEPQLLEAVDQAGTIDLVLPGMSLNTLTNLPG